MAGDATAGLEKSVRGFLATLEREEAKLLTWGVVDGGFTENDLDELAQRFCERWDDEAVEPRALIDALFERRVLVDLPWQGRRIYRTRMGEAVRLFARLRQMFRFSDWQTGASLVSDFRFGLRERSYPKRNIPKETALARWQDAGVLNGMRRAALGGLLDRPGFSGLAEFQVRATQRMLQDLDGGRTRGMIVSVGTGSGKTLAFYLPALAHLATLVNSDRHWTKAVALYPRNELLKDQFSETYLEARRLDDALSGRRKLTIGAYFGPTPSVAAKVKKKWGAAPGGGGYICPYLRCPKPRCEGELIWRTEDVNQQVERLRCATCGTLIHEDEIYLTRRRMQQTPPDVLFTTTEMLNRSIGDSYSRHVFGVGATSAPQVVLLDEVHTYVGTHGAQVALLLRRWQRAVRSAVQFTGLSATLRNASDFFGQLVGLNSSSVEEIAPGPQDLESEGMEYLLALRGDPASKTSLLSTTIQASMLLRRVLDPRRRVSANGFDGPSGGMYGSRVFVFTDDLDVTNRLYHNLLDAEGVDSQGRPIPPPRGKRLASLRSRQQPDNARRLVAGQSWQLAEEIGHPEGLSNPLAIGRTSSQDTGVDRASDIIVATASLEVGYNDPEVGAVIQHKAPRDIASFVQRKGRAGRHRLMRPWTVVVLSDYGRDRLAYQGYEQLFDPALSPRTLPVRNRYVLRMQAVFAFMDWLANRLPAVPKGNVYYDLSGPATAEYPSPLERHRAEATILRRVLEGDPQIIASLEQYLGTALQISLEEVQILLWEPPRSLMLHVLPTALRRLETEWRRIGAGTLPDQVDYVVPESPLPEFVSGSLFSDLNLPEVAVTTSSGFQERVDQLPALQALRTLVPGKVTRRFAVKSSKVSHWTPLPDLDPTATNQQICVEDVCTDFEELGRFSILDGQVVRSFRCVRPWGMVPQLVPSRVNPTSNAWLEWRSQILPIGRGLSLELPKDSGWASLINEVRVLSHAYHAWVETRRFAPSARANIRFNGRDIPPLSAHVHFRDKEGGAASLGLVANVDGLCFVVSVPTNVIDINDENLAKLRGFRTAYFRHRVLADPVLSERTNVFQRDWLYQVYLSALTAWAIREETTLELASRGMAPLLEKAAYRVLDVIFETLAIEDDGGEERAEEDGDRVIDVDGNRKRSLRDEVHALFGDTVIAQRLQELAACLWAAGDAEWDRWAAARYVSTLGGAIVEACRQLFPEAGADELMLDIEPGPRVDGDAAPTGLSEIWLTESTIGGGGVIEEITRRYAEDPRRFYRLVESALGPSDHEIKDTELTYILELIAADTQVAAAIDSVRAAHRHEDLLGSVARLEEVFVSKNVLVTHSVMSAVHARILRPGSSGSTDRLLLDVVQRWKAEEARLGIEVDARVFAFLMSQDSTAQRLLGDVDAQAANDQAFRFHALYGLLWPRGNVIRSLALASYNPFAELPPPDRELVLDLLPQESPVVALEDADWRVQVRDALRTYGSARLVCSRDQAHALRAALLSMAADPFEMDFLHVYPEVEGIERRRDGFAATLRLSEALQ